MFDESYELTLESTSSRPVNLDIKVSEVIVMRHSLNSGRRVLD
jgi:hypothetical protein